MVLGEAVIAAMTRQAPQDDFRSNLHQGGRAAARRLDPHESRLAIDAVLALGLDFAGVDLIQGPNGPLVLEVNSSPGLEGIEKATGVAVASQIIAFIEHQCAHINRRARPSGSIPLHA